MELVRLLTFTTLFPNAVQGTHAPFVEERLQQLLRATGWQASVVAPVPWFPLRAKLFGRYAELARVPPRENRSGLEVWHPRYPVIPKVGMNAAPALMARAVLPAVRTLARERRYDLLDAHYLYPDGVAAARIAHALALPLVLTARGTDVNVIARFDAPRRMILEAIGAARCVIAVSAALREKLLELGAPAERVVVVRNGVDRERFRPLDGGALRSRLGVRGRLALCVGRIDANKGQRLVLDAVARREAWSLAVIGDGPDRVELQRRAAALGLGHRVHFAGTVARGALAEWYGAADVLVLASEREGLPNVVLESLACGTAVVATGAGGVPEVLGGAPGCTILAERSAAAIEAALKRIEEGTAPRDAIRSYSERFGAERCAADLTAVLRGVAGRERTG
jgi:glycosyltransferase involved in cell wall biosynthesis